jgi:hypothetical protein
MPNITQNDDQLFKSLKLALMLGGGAIAAPAGGIGAIAGAAGGNMLGQKIEDLYQNQQGNQTSNSDLIPAAVQGATSEMGGQLAGKLVSKIAGGLAGTVTKSRPLSDVVEYDGTDPRIEYHGSDQKVLEPQAGLSIMGNKGPNVYNTSPELQTAKDMGSRKLRDSLFAGQNSPTIITENMVAKGGNQYNLLSPVGPNKALELGQQLGLSPEAITNSINFAKQGNGTIDSTDLWTSYLGSMNQARKMGSGGTLEDLGGQAVEKLKALGYDRIHTNIDPNFDATETAHFYPERDLYPIGSQKYKNLLSSLKYQAPADVPYMSAIPLLSKALVNQLNTGGVKQ